VELGAAVVEAAQPVALQELAERLAAVLMALQVLEDGFQVLLRRRVGRSEPEENII
jgi:hypothetical protein